jgi:hypothetical protein
MKQLIVAAAAADTNSLRLIGFGLSAVTLLVALTAVAMVAQATATGTVADPAAIHAAAQ